MAKINEPSRVIQRGKTRLIGEPRRPHEGAGTPATRAVSSSNNAPVGKPRSRDDGQGRFAQGEAREVAPRPVPATTPQQDGPRTQSEERRPLERIQTLEGKVEQLESKIEQLMLAVLGSAEPSEPGEPPPLLARVEDMEAVQASLAETQGELLLVVGSSGTDEAPATGLVAAVATLSNQLSAAAPDTLPPAGEAPTQPEATLPPGAEA